MKIDAKFLLRPGNGNNAAGAFYIALDDPKVHITIHGPNNQNASGTVTQVKDQHSVRKKVREKTRKNYTEVSPSSISSGALQNAVEHIRKAYPSLKDAEAKLSINCISFDVGEPASTARPKTNANKLSDMWF